MKSKEIDRIECAIRHIRTAVDVDPWAVEIAVDAMRKLLVKDNHDFSQGLVKDTISRQGAIDTEGLDEEVRCEMCRNQMKTDRGCDGNCKYDEKLYEKIMQILYERIKPLPSAQPEIIRCRDCIHAIEDALCGGYWCKGKAVTSNHYCGYAERRNDG